MNMTKTVLVTDKMSTMQLIYTVGILSLLASVAHARTLPMNGNFFQFAGNSGDTYGEIPKQRLFASQLRKLIFNNMKPAADVMPMTKTNSGTSWYLIHNWHWQVADFTRLRLGKRSQPRYDSYSTIDAWLTNFAKYLREITSKQPNDSWFPSFCFLLLPFSRWFHPPMFINPWRKCSVKWNWCMRGWPNYLPVSRSIISQ